ncbi:uncharacterized protein LOC144331435 [Macaca mulatta]
MDRRKAGRGWEGSGCNSGPAPFSSPAQRPQNCSPAPRPLCARSTEQLRPQLAAAEAAGQVVITTWGRGALLLQPDPQLRSITEFPEAATWKPSALLHRWHGGDARNLGAAAPACSAPQPPVGSAAKRGAPSIRSEAGGPEAEDRRPRGTPVPAPPGSRGSSGSRFKAETATGGAQNTPPPSVPGYAGTILKPAAKSESCGRVVGGAWPPRRVLSQAAPDSAPQGRPWVPGLCGPRAAGAPGSLLAAAETELGAQTAPGSFLCPVAGAADLPLRHRGRALIPRGGTAPQPGKLAGPRRPGCSCGGEAGPCAQVLCAWEQRLGPFSPDSAVVFRDLGKVWLNLPIFCGGRPVAPLAFTVTLGGKGSQTNCWFYLGLRR